jgi:hypothetical protein
VVDNDLDGSSELWVQRQVEFKIDVEIWVLIGGKWNLGSTLKLGCLIGGRPLVAERFGPIIISKLLVYRR